MYLKGVARARFGETHFVANSLALRWSALAGVTCCVRSRPSRPRRVGVSRESGERVKRSRVAASFGSTIRLARILLAPATCRLGSLNEFQLVIKSSWPADATDDGQIMRILSTWLRRLPLERLVESRALSKWPAEGRGQTGGSGWLHKSLFRIRCTSERDVVGAAQSVARRKLRRLPLRNAQSGRRSRRLGTVSLGRCSRGSLGRPCT